MLAKAGRSRQGLICADCGTPVGSGIDAQGLPARWERALTIALMVIGSGVIFSLVMLNEMREPGLDGEPATIEQPTRGE